MTTAKIQAARDEMNGIVHPSAGVSKLGMSEPAKTGGDAFTGRARRLPSTGACIRYRIN
jgi:hypothetical protein